MASGRVSDNKTALITGASSGIGLELARDSYYLVLVARSENRLRELADELQQAHCIQVTVLAQDLSLPNALDAIYEALQKQKVQVDVLINNAGIGTYGPFAEIDWDKERELLQINIVALTHLTRLFLPAMLQRRDGKILNVASTAAFQPGPLMAVYYASKAFVLSFSQALSNECENSGVTVTALCPGPTQSDFQERAQMTQSKLVQGTLMSSKEVAAQGYKAMQKGKRRVVTGRSNRAWTIAAKFLPTTVTLKIIRRVQETKKETNV
jgi:short-subunit dehydrogenase